MTGKELLDKLTESKTGAAKIEAAKNLLAAEPHQTGSQLYNAMSAAGFGDGTLAKAREFLGDEAPPPPEFVQQPFPVRAPVGGCDVQGRHYAAGQRVPAVVLKDATPAEIRSLHEDGNEAIELKPVDPKGGQADDGKKGQKPVDPKGGQAK